MTIDLIPLNTYLSQFSFWRTTLIMATFMSAAIWLIATFTGVAYRTLDFVLLIIGSLMFGAFMARSMRGVIAKFFEEHSQVVPALADGAYEFRAVANLVKSRWNPVGGHLYFGPAGLTFLPHLKNRPADREPRSATWERVTRIAPVNAGAPLLVRALSEKPVSHLQVEVDGDRWLFRLPDAERVSARLCDFLDPARRTV